MASQDKPQVDVPSDQPPSYQLELDDIEVGDGEQAEAEAAGLSAEVPDGVPVYVHLDADVLDPSVMAAQFAVPGGWDERRLRAQLAELVATCRIVGVEVTALEEAGVAPLLADALAPLLR